VTRFTLGLCSLVCGFLVLVFLLQSSAVARNVLGEGIDCTEVSVHYKEDPNLTREERIQQMDEAFLESLNKFEICESIKKQKKNSNGSGGLDGDGQNSAQNNSGAQSTASTTMSGTEKVESHSTVASQNSGSTGTEDVQTAHQNTGADGGKLISSNGKTPEDIPLAENDDTLAAQIRYAAENETDPVKKKKLWNEYRKYKGLPPKT